MALSEEERSEYAQILHRREMLVDRSVSWGVVFVPFALYAPVFVFITAHVFWFLGAVAGWGALAWWQAIRKRQDALVVEMYDRLIALEHKGGMHLVRSYLSARLHEVPKRELEQEGLRCGEDPTPENLPRFKKVLTAIRRGHGIYDRYTRLYTTVILALGALYYFLLAIGYLPPALR